MLNIDESACFFMTDNYLSDKGFYTYSEKRIENKIIWDNL